jgi:prophage DNA circulation protein
MQRIAQEVAGLRHAVFGNGKRGLIVQVEDLTESLADVTTTLAKVASSVKALADEAAAERHMREGSRRTLRQIRAIALAVLALLGAGGGWMFTSLRSALNDLAPFVQ